MSIESAAQELRVRAHDLRTDANWSREELAAHLSSVATELEEAAPRPVGADSLAQLKAIAARAIAGARPGTKERQLADRVQRWIEETEADALP